MLMRYFFSFCSLYGFLEPGESKLTSLSMNWQIPQTCDEGMKLTSLSLLSIGSYLTDPACTIDQYMTSFAVVNELPPSPYLKESLDSFVAPFDLGNFDTGSFAKGLHKTYLAMGIAFATPLTPLGLVGIACRNVARWIDPELLTVLRGELFPADLPYHRQFTISTENWCGIEGGYAIKEGGVIPIVEWPISNRLEALIENIRDRRPDVLCLQEIFNVNHARYIAYRLKDLYANFVFGCGAKAVGPSSGLFFATIFDIDKAVFQPFTKEELAGTAVHCGKGILEMDLKDSKGAIATIYALHLNHSENPEKANKEPDAQRARKAEMDAILEKIEKGGDRNVIVLGDLNMDNQEIQEQNLLEKFQKDMQYTNLKGEVEQSWGGDEWYVKFSNRPTFFERFIRATGLIEKEVNVEKRTPSSALDLDHIMVYVRENYTPELQGVHLEETGYDSTQISWQALSDHRPLSGIVTIKDR